MEALYKEFGSDGRVKRLYKVYNNIIIELDMSQYQHGVIGCTTADIRTEVVKLHPDCRSTSQVKFERYFNEFMAFINKANNPGSK